MRLAKRPIRCVVASVPKTADGTYLECRQERVCQGNGGNDATEENRHFSYRSRRSQLRLHLKRANCGTLEKGSLDMPRYLISFDDGSMDHIPEGDWPAVGEASHAVVREAKAAGIWIFGGGVLRQQATIVSTDGTISRGPLPETKAVVGGFR